VPLCSGIATRTILSTIILVFKELLLADRADGAYLRIVYTKLGSVVEDGMDVQGRVGRLPSRLTQAMDEGLLKIICKVILSSKEDNSTFRDWLLVRLPPCK
jgi:hypothetical protein